MVVNFSAVFSVLAVGLFACANACGIWGQVFCDYCWDGQFTSGTDKYLSGIEVYANCSVEKAGRMVYYWGNAVTDSSGLFETAISGTTNLLGKRTAEDSFLFAFFESSRFTKGMLKDVKLVNCDVKVDAPLLCPTLALNDGTLITNGKPGNGRTSSNVAIVQYRNTDSADIYIGGKMRENSVALTPTVRGGGISSFLKGCPVAPPPPPGLTGDPHFTGADGSRFDFTGEPSQTYCLVSDSHVHVNAYYGGRWDKWGDKPSKPLTWIRQLAVLWGDHSITLAVREGSRWQYDSGYMSMIMVDGESVSLPTEGDSFSSADGAIEISWLAAKTPSADDLVDVYSLRIDNVLLMRLTLRPEIQLLRTPQDGLVHFDVEFPRMELSDNAHGVLGQTFRSDHRFRLSKQQMVYSDLLRTQVVPGDNAEGFLDGSEKDYRSTGLLQADCRVARFSRASSASASVKKGLQLVSGEATSTLSLGRKMIIKKGIE